MLRNQLCNGALIVLTMVIVLTGCSFPGSTTGAAEVKNQKGGKEAVVNVYSARHYTVDDRLYEAFTNQTGIKVNQVKGTAEELVARMKQEGAASEADLFIAVDGGVLDYAKQSGVLQPLESEQVLAQVPVQWRDPDQHWVGIATRARVIVYAKDRVDPSELSTYEDLTSDKWKGRVLVRSASNLYNHSLLASFIELNGEQDAEAWARGIVANLARSPEGGDRSQAKAVISKVGDVAIMNTYYVGQMSISKDVEEAATAANLGIFFPNQHTTGTHLNVSGAGLAKFARNQEHAVKLIEYMTSKAGQTLLSQGSFEFPVNEEAEVPALLAAWGEFKAQQIDFTALGRHRNKAIEIFNRAGWQ
ncbi:extracellular solute-binding protein [Paenibacillaceae bacterium]|nr:extracellular solute-binding protein [Paenibacillaceae bacterium]